VLIFMLSTEIPNFFFWQVFPVKDAILIENSLKKYVDYQ